MSEQGYERKKDFVNHALSRCVASMYPNVCRVAYHTRDTDEGLRETAMIYLAGGYSRRVDGIDGTLGSECFGIHGAAVGIPSLRHWNSNLRL